MNAFLVRTQVRVMAKRVGIDITDCVIFLTVPTALEVARRLPRRSLLYNRSDLHSAFEETDQDYIRQLENALFTECDAVLYASRTLMETEKSFVKKDAVFFDHGVDQIHFSRKTAPEPIDIARIPRPRIGFFGGIDDYVVDLGLLTNMSRAPSRQRRWSLLETQPAQ